MKVLHVTSHVGSRAAGVGEVVNKLANAQKQCGADVEVLALSENSKSQHVVELGDVRTTLVPVLGPQVFGYSPQMVKSIFEFSPDIVHLHGLWMHPGRSVLQWHNATGMPYVVSPHGMLSAVSLSYSSIKKRFVSAWFQRQVLQRSSAIHATCEPEKKDIRNFGLNVDVSIFPNGVDAQPECEIEFLDETRYIISLGRISPIKSLDTLVTAWRELEEKFPNWSLQIVGPDEGGELKRLKVLAKNLKLKRLFFEGPIYGDEKNNVMRNASVFALPTKNENFALTVAESLMLNVPVISSKGAPWSELEKFKCGLWVDHGSAPMKKALETMMNLTDEQRKQMGNNGRNWMLRDFAWESVARKALTTYSNVSK